jgi:hypothetical protein
MVMKKKLLRFSLCSIFCINKAKPLVVVFIFIFSSTVMAIPKVWIGQGVGGGAGSDFNTAANWSPAGVPIAADDVTIAFDNFGIINLSANASIRNLTITMVGNNNSGILNVFTNTLTINGTTSVDILSGNANTQLVIGVNDAVSGGTIDFVGNAIFGLTNDGNAVFIKGNVNSRLIFRGDFTQGTNTAITPGTEPGTLLFDGTGMQNFKADDDQFICNYGNVIIGSTNNPTVNLIVGLDPLNDDFLGNLSINGSAILNIGLSQWNRKTAGGIFSLSNTAKIILSNNTGGIVGSNFPLNFTTYTLDSITTADFNGTVAQTIPGITQLVTSYGNLSMSGNTKTLGSDIAVYRNLTVGANTTMALSNFNAALKSNNQTTAYVSVVPTSAAITYGTGRFNIERYLPAYNAWRLLATPIERLATDATTATIANSWREGTTGVASTLLSNGFGTQITGPAGPVLPLNTAVLDVYTQRGSMKSYDASTNTFVEITNANTTTIANKEGYFVFVRGDRGVGVSGGPAATNLRIKGKILTGDQMFTVPVNSFQSFGNPYPSRIDFRTVYNGTISPSYYVWNPNPVGTIHNAGKYEVYIDYGDGNYRLGNITGSIRNYIESGQAVFIQSVTGGNITVKESDKFGGSSVVSRVGNEEHINATTPTLAIHLLAKDVSGQNLFADAATINFDNAFSNATDNLDVKKINNSFDNLAIKNNNTFLVVDRRKTLIENDTIKLNISKTRVAQYGFQINPSGLSSTELNAFLLDNFLQTSMPVSLIAETNVLFDITSNTASKASNRFVIVFKQAPTTNFTTISANRNVDNTIIVNWAVQNETNINNYTVEHSNDGLNFTTLATKTATSNTGGNPIYSQQDALASKAANWYRVKANNTNGTNKYTSVAMVNALPVEELNSVAKMHISPNPVEAGNVNVYFINQPEGRYSILVRNKAGQVVKIETVRILANNILRTINIGKATAGAYQVTVTSEEGNKTTLPFVIK